MRLPHQLQGFFCLCVYQLFYFSNDLILQSFTRPVLHSELTFDRILEYFLSFVQHLYFPTYVLTASFQVDKAVPLRLPQLFFYLPKYFKNLLAIFISRLLGHLLNGNTDLHSHLQSFLQFSDAHFHIITVVMVSQHFLGQVLEGSPSPSSVFHQHPMVFFFSS